MCTSGVWRDRSLLGGARLHMGHVRRLAHLQRGGWHSCQYQRKNLGLGTGQAKIYGSVRRTSGQRELVDELFWGHVTGQLGLKA
jgi:hypothetical protein